MQHFSAILLTSDLGSYALWPPETESRSEGGMADRNNKPWISYLLALLLLTYKTIISDRSDDFEFSVDNYTCTLLHFGFL